MTDREKLIELIIDAKRTDPETGNFAEHLADYLLTNGVMLQKWIPVTERLPEIGVPVLVTYRSALDGTPQGDGLAAQLFGEECWYWWEGSEEDCDCEVAVEITHWMPLPEPPERMEK